MQLLLLHGALGSAAQFEALSDVIKGHVPVQSLTFSGHGGQSSGAGFSIARFATDVLEWMESRQIPKVDLFGYSMGGYVALYLARNHPLKIGSVFTLATKFNWNPDTARSEAAMLDAEHIKTNLPAFAAGLIQRHGVAEWEQVLAKTAAMILHMGNAPELKADDLRSIKQKVRLAVGDRDKMVSQAETAAAAEQLQNAELVVLPNTPHPVERVDMKLLSDEMLDFFCKK